HLLDAGDQVEASLFRQIGDVPRKNTIDQGADHQENPVIGIFLGCKRRTKLRVAEQRAYFGFQHSFKGHTWTVAMRRPTATERSAKPGRFTPDLLRHAFRFGIEHKLQKRMY